MLDYGLRGVRHPSPADPLRCLGLPFAREACGLKKALAGDWQLNWIFTARPDIRSRCWTAPTAAFSACAPQDPVGIDRNATGGDATENPNEFNLLDLTPLCRPPAATSTR